MSLKSEYEYSVDMVKFRYRIFNKRFESFFQKYNNLYGNVETWEDNRIGKCKYNFSIKQGIDKSFWVGFKLNSPNRDNKKKSYMYLRYNPNKVKVKDELKEILEEFFIGRDFEIVSADIAIDLKNISMKSDIFIDKDMKNTIKDHRYSENDRTYYIGKSGRDGYVKVYNKAKEQGIDDMDWTRYEITIKPNKTVDSLRSYLYKGGVPKIYVINNFEYDFSLTDTDWCLLQGLLNKSFKPIFS